MSNRYLVEGGRRAQGVHDLFDTVASRYDLINDLQSFGLHRLWKRRLVNLAGVRPGERALDLCCGTGDIAFDLAARGAQVIGVDFSAPMLAIAKVRGSKRGSRNAENPSFELGDARALPFGEASFDVVTIGYGLRNLPSIEAGLIEMARVTQPRGRVLILDFGKPANRVWRALYFLHLRTVVPLLGRIFCRDADTYAYILASLKGYPDADEITRRMEVTGWRDVCLWNLLGGVMTIHRGIRA